jgi:hypothetical protein
MSSIDLAFTDPNDHAYRLFQVLTRTHKILKEGFISFYWVFETSDSDDQWSVHCLASVTKTGVNSHCTAAGHEKTPIRK